MQRFLIQSCLFSKEIDCQYASFSPQVLRQFKRADKRLKINWVRKKILLPPRYNLSDGEASADIGVACAPCMSSREPVVCEQADCYVAPRFRKGVMPMSTQQLLEQAKDPGMEERILPVEDIWESTDYSVTDTQAKSSPSSISVVPQESSACANSNPIPS
jgi:hypothetical protein